MLGEFCWIIGCPLTMILHSVRGGILFLLFVNYDAPHYNFTSLSLRQSDKYFKMHGILNRHNRAQVSSVTELEFFFLYDNSERHFSCQSLVPHKTHSLSDPPSWKFWTFLQHKFTLRTQLSDARLRVLLGGGCTSNGLRKVRAGQTARNQRL